MKSNQETEIIERAYCQQCGMGVLHVEIKTLFRIINNDVVFIPDFPLWKCDICKWIEYDDESLEQLIRVVGPSFLVNSGSSSINFSNNRHNKGSWIFWQI